MRDEDHDDDQRDVPEGNVIPQRDKTGLDVGVQRWDKYRSDGEREEHSPPLILEGGSGITLCLYLPGRFVFKLAIEPADLSINSGFLDAKSTVELGADNFCNRLKDDSQNA